MSAAFAFRPPPAGWPTVESIRILFGRLATVHRMLFSEHLDNGTDYLRKPSPFEKSQREQLESRCSRVALKLTQKLNLCKHTRLLPQIAVLRINGADSTTSFWIRSFDLDFAARKADWFEKLAQISLVITMATELLSLFERI